MTRFVSGVTGLIGAAALVIAGSSVDLQAQRGAAAGHGRPVTPGVQGQGHGRPATPGTTTGRTEHQPDTDHAKADHGKGATHETGTTGRPAVGDQLTRNTNLTSRLQTLFPAGTDLQKESTGFRNLGQFVAAAHVSHNLDIPWTDLKAKMTGDHPVSLGAAIKDLKPQADATTEAAKAQKDANTEIKDTAKTGTTTTAS